MDSAIRNAIQTKVGPKANEQGSYTKTLLKHKNVQEAENDNVNY